jgi:anti-sigma regulatory factor (Ser/Thr protein kinase)
MARCWTLVPVSDPSQVGQARREANVLAERAGLGDTDRGRVAIVVTELANNLARHARGGEILLRPSSAPDDAGVEVFAIDRGPGMADVAACLRDGFSTGGTPGTGLGAVRRMAARFEVDSVQPAGTVVFASVLAGGPTANGTLANGASANGASANGAAARPEFEWAVICLPVKGETACGDTWRLASRPGRLSLMIADGLGHGPLASDAAEAAGAAFDADPFAAPRALIESAHTRMHGSRGGAVAAVALEGGTVRFAGVGNVAGSLVSPAAGPKGLPSHNGIAGVQVRKVQEFDYPWPDGGMLVMHSDGLQTRWSLDAYPGAARRHPAVVAGLLYRDFARGRDDLTVAVVRRAGADR